MSVLSRFLNWFKAKDLKTENQFQIVGKAIVIFFRRTLLGLSLLVSIAIFLSFVFHTNDILIWLLVYLIASPIIVWLVFLL